MSNVFSNDMDILTDMFDNVHTDNIKQDENECYYIGKAENILNQLTNKENYFIFLKTIMKNYHIMELEQKQAIKDLFFSKQEQTEKTEKTEKTVVKKKLKNKKPKLNMNDDY